MKKRLVPLLSVLLILLACSACASQKVTLSAEATGAVVYRHNGVAFEEALTVEQLEAVIDIVDGKKLPPETVTGVPNCYFTENIAIVLDGRRFLLACDSCAMLKDSQTQRYISLSETECQTLHEIFAVHGGTFPCI